MARFIDKVINGGFEDGIVGEYSDAFAKLEESSRGYTKKQIISRLISGLYDEMEQYFDDERQLSAILSAMQTLMDVCTSDWFLNERE